MASNRSKIAQTTIPEANLDRVFQICAEQTSWLAKMKEALDSGDDAQLKIYARKLCGLSAESSPKPPRAKLKGGSKHGKKYGKN